MAMQPECIVLDEPTAMLVGAFEVHIRRELEVVAMLADGGVGNA